MNVNVQLFARVRDIAGAGAVTLDLCEGATVADLKRALGERFPAMRPLLPQLLVAIGTDYAIDEESITSKATLACFPPVSGG